MEASKKPELT